MLLGSFELVLFFHWVGKDELLGVTTKLNGCHIFSTTCSEDCLDHFVIVEGLARAPELDSRQELPPNINPCMHVYIIKDVETVCQTLFLDLFQHHGLHLMESLISLFFVVLQKIDDVRVRKGWLLGGAGWRREVNDRRARLWLLHLVSILAILNSLGNILRPRKKKSPL